MNIDKYFAQPLSSNDMLKLNPIVIPDANFLLAAYQWRSVTMKEVQNSLEKFHKINKLKIPLQVIREFTKNRPVLIQNKIQEIEMEINKLTPIKKLENIVPILENSSPYSDTEKSRIKHEKSTKDLKQNLQSIKVELSNLFSNDPYFDFIKKISADCVYISDDKIGIEQIKKTAKERFDKKIPPGYKDSGKGNQNSEGDYIIWHDILSLKENVIFVSGDQKEDWVYTDRKGENNKILSSKIELLIEYAEKTDGKHFLHMSPKDFITFLNPEVDAEIKIDLEKENFFSIDFENIKKTFNDMQKYSDGTKSEYVDFSYNNNLKYNSDSFLVFTSKSISHTNKNRLINSFIDSDMRLGFFEEHKVRDDLFYTSIAIKYSNELEISLVNNHFSTILGNSLMSIEQTILE